MNTTREERKAALAIMLMNLEDQVTMTPSQDVDYGRCAEILTEKLGVPVVVFPVPVLGHTPTWKLGAYELPTAPGAKP